MADSEEVREQWNNMIIDFAKKQNLNNVEITNTVADQGGGMVAQFYTSDVLDKETGEIRFVAIKIAPAWDFDYGPIFKNEYIFYSKILPALKNLQIETGVSKLFDNVPKYFCGGVIPKQEYISMENLKPLGYLLFDKKQYLDKQHLEMIFKTYGKFHALSFVLRNKDEEKYRDLTKDLTRHIPKFLEKSMIDSVSAAVSGIDRDNDKLLYEATKNLGENAFQLYLEALSYTGEYRCIIHGDCWSNNMMFKYSESGELLDLKILDFQICRDGTPIHDLSYFFYSGASKMDFDNLEKYLKIYHKSFSEFAKQLGAYSSELFSFEILKSEWKKNSLFGVILGVHLWQMKLLPKEKFSHILQPNSGQRPSVEESEKLWKIVLDEIRGTDEYKEKTSGILRHALEYGILNKNKT